MKTSLIFFLLVSATAFAADKKVDMREGTHAVDEKYLDALSGKDNWKTKEVSQDTRPVDKTQQMDSKRTRQYQEEEPVEAIKRQR